MNLDIAVLKKRIENEIKMLCRKYEKIEINLCENIITVYDMSNTYEFIISESYPFVPPKIYYNNVDYVDFLKIKNTSFNSILYSIHKLDCFCCNSLTCKGKWNVSFTMDDIILEIQKYKKYKRDVINKLFADKIKMKYLISDINLEQYL
jgi:hypothetical protein